MIRQIVRSAKGRFAKVAFNIKKIKFFANYVRKSKKDMFLVPHHQIQIYINKYRIIRFLILYINEFFLKTIEKFEILKLDTFLYVSGCRF